MQPVRNTLIGLGATATVMGGVDAAVLNEQPLDQVEIIASERVEARQVGNVVETTFPWKDQPGLKVKVDLGEPTIAERFADKRKREVITETVTDFEGGFKVDILLHEKPDTNIFCYEIEGAENYNFFYQPELTPEEIAEGARRPEHIVGSLAVYHKDKRDHVLGKENYGNGKVMHIPRPEVWELNNPTSTREWAKLSYSEPNLCVTVRQGFLDNAEYPVRVDPTFGYTSVGASNNIFSNDRFYGFDHSAPSDGTLTAITLYGQYESGPTNIKGVTTGSGYTILANGVGSAVALPASAGWSTSTYTTGPGISNGTSYWLGFVIGPSNTARLYYDHVSSAGWADNTNSYASPSDPTDGLSLNFEISIYATYSGPMNVETDAVSSIADTSVTANGEIIEVGAENADLRGFLYDTSSHATPTATNSLDDSEGFETGLGGWTDTDSSNCWERDSGGTPSSNTGPDSGANSTTWYMFTETSSSNCNSSDDDSIEYTLSTTSAGYVDFYYHMYGSDMGTLSLDAWDGSTWTEVWSRTGQDQTASGDAYVNVTTPDTDFPSDTTKIRFHYTGATGFRGDAAVDDIEVFINSDAPAASSTSYASFTEESGDFGTGSFTGSLTGLTAETTYYIRAWAWQATDGYVYGNEQSFTTSAAGGGSQPVQSEIWFD